MSKGLKYTLYGILALDVLGLILAYIFAETACCDEFEHLRMSYLVSQGYMPYRDFFEHHHPLLWYVFAPFMMMLPQNFISVYYTSRFLSFIFSCGTLYVIYRIFKDFFENKKLFVYFFLTVMVFYPIWYGFSFFKPDIYERFFYVAGLYYFLRYFRDIKTKDLTICGLLFAISFLFLQTAVFDILPFLIISAVMIYKNPNNYKNFITASISALMLLLLVAAFLFYTDTVEQYFQLNWIFNSKVFSLQSKFVDKGSIIYAFFLHFAGVFAALFWLYKNKKLNKYTNIIALLFIFSIIQHLCFKAYYAHYLILPFIFCSMIVAVFLENIAEKKEYRSLFCYIVAFFFCSFILNCITLYIKNNTLMLREMKKMNSTKETGIVVSGNVYKIYAPLISYYVMHTDISTVDNELFNRFPDYNINEIITKYEPLYLDYDNDGNGFKLPAETLQNYEKISRYLWQRKDTLYQ